MKFLKLVIIFILFNTTSFADKNMKIGSKGKLSEVDRVIKVKVYDIIFLMNNSYNTNSRRSYYVVIYEQI